MIMKDEILSQLIKSEIERQQLTIDLIASENYVSKEILAILGSPLTNKYSEGYPGKRYYPGNQFYDEIERLAIARALKLFGLDEKEWGVNIQALSGSPANMAVYAALLSPGDTILGMSLSSGGHLSHGHKVSFTGRMWRSIQYNVNIETGLIDYGAVRALALKEKPKLIISGFTAYPRIIDFKKFGEIASEVGAYHLADISHIAGLIAGGAHPSPYPFADVVMTTTHKSLRGPRGAVIFSRKDERDLPSKIDKAVFPGLQGGPHNNVTAAKAQAFLEASSPEFKNYAMQIVRNAKALAGELIKNGFVLLGGGTDNHLMLLDARPLGLDGRKVEEILEAGGITANRNSLPGDEKPLKPSGVRIGTPAVTTRGMKEVEMAVVASFFKRLLVDKEDPQKVGGEVGELCKKFPLPY